MSPHYYDRILGSHFWSFTVLKSGCCLNGNFNSLVTVHSGLTVDKARQWNSDSQNLIYQEHNELGRFEKCHSPRKKIYQSTWLTYNDNEIYLIISLQYYHCPTFFTAYRTHGKDLMVLKATSQPFSIARLSL